MTWRLITDRYLLFCADLTLQCRPRHGEWRWWVKLLLNDVEGTAPTLRDAQFAAIEAAETIFRKRRDTADLALAECSAARGTLG